MSNYPNNLDDSISLPIATSGGGSGSVPDATSTVKGILKLTNDLGGTASLPKVIRIQERLIDDSEPTEGQALVWSDLDGYWTPKSISSSDATTSSKGIIQINGDIDGVATSISVIKIQGRSVLNSAPSNKQVLTWINSNNRWEPTDLPDASNLQKGIIMLSGDLTGTAASPVVAKIQTKDISVQEPNLDEVLTWNGSEWEPLPLPNATDSIAGTIIISGDLDGTYNDIVVSAIQNNAISNSSPSNKNVLTWSSLNTQWEPQSLPSASLETAGIINLAGDLGGTSSSPSVTKIRGSSISLTSPSSDGQVLTWDNLNSEWYPAAIPPQQDATSSAKGLVKLTNDLGGTASLPIVTGIQGYDVSSSIPEDGYVFVYSGSQWEPIFIDGYSELTILGGIKELIGLGSNTFTSIGSIKINSDYYGTNAIFIFESLLQASASQTAEIRLYNLTDGAVVSSSTLSTISNSFEYLSVVLDLSGNKIYEAQIRITNVSPGVSDGVICGNSTIKVKYI